MLAVSSEFDDIRRTAIELLATRPSRDYLGTLVELIHAPAEYAVQPVQGPGSGGLLVVETPRYHLERPTKPRPHSALGVGFTGYVGYDINGLPIVMTGREIRNRSKAALSPSVGSGVAIFATALPSQYVMAQAEQRTAVAIAAANLKAAAAQEWLAADIRDLEQSNARAAAVNARVGQILRQTFRAPDMKDDEIACQPLVLRPDRLQLYAPTPGLCERVGAEPSCPFIVQLLRRRDGCPYAPRASPDRGNPAGRPRAQPGHRNW